MCLLKKGFLTLFFFFVTFFFSAQKDAFSQLKEKYDKFTENNHGDSALWIAKEMQIWAKNQKGDTSQQYIESLIAISGAYYELGNIDSALVNGQLALSRLEMTGKRNTVTYARSLTKMALVYLEQIDFEKAEPLFQEASSLYLNLLGNRHVDYANSLNNLGALYYYNGDYNEALQFYIQTTEIYKSVFGDTHPDIANGLNNIGTLYSVLGDNKSTLTYYQESLEMYKAVYGEMHPDYATSLNNLGTYYFDIGDYQTSETYYLQAFEIGKKVIGESHSDFASTLNNLGVLYYAKGDYRAAELMYKKAEEIIKRINGESHPDFAMCLINLGSLYSDMGDFKNAEAHYKKALRIYQETLGDKHPNIARCLDNLGIVYSDMGKLKLSKEFMEKSAVIFKESFGESHPEYAASLLNIGDVYFDLGDTALAESMYQKAEVILKESLGTTHSDYALSLKKIGLLYFARGDYQNAETTYRQALDIRKEALGEQHPNYLSTQKELAILLAKMNKEKDAFKILDGILQRTTKSISDNFEWLNDNQKESYWEQEKEFYDQLSWFAHRSHLKVPESAALNYNAALISKSKLLEAKISSENYYREVDELREELAFRRRLVTKMESDGSEEKEKLEVLRNEADSLDKRLSLSWPEYAEQKKNLSITWQQVQQHLDKNEAAIEFVRFENENDSLFYYNALVLRKDDEQPILIELCKEKELEGISPKMGFSAFYPLIWEPMENALKGISTIYYAPTGLLYNVPFPALYAPKAKGDQLVPGKTDKRGVVTESAKVMTEENASFLVDRYTLHQLTSTRYLAMGIKQKAKNPISKDMAMVGGVNYDYLPGDNAPELKKGKKDKNATRSSNSASGKLAFLEGTRVEIDQIRSTAAQNTWTTAVLSGNEAKEENIVKLEGKEAKGILHLATHGYSFPAYDFNDSTIRKNSLRYSYRFSQNPMVRSGLILSGGNWAWTGSDTLTKLGAEQNGILTASEVAQLNLKKTKLVVLSACETGLGTIDGSEGTFGLKRGFKLAGVEQLIVSLWSVPDKETMELMTLFYTDLTKTLNPIASFEKAQKEMRNKYPQEPEKWAGFVLVR
jgi:CHAT domain-containing protein/tetratricopeptide (TPR) repeat protein